jgi:hypothetical protein
MIIAMLVAYGFLIGAAIWLGVRYCVLHQEWLDSLDNND